jgi:hydrogenase-4 component F
VICAVLLIPAVAAVLSLLIRNVLVRRVILVLTGVGPTAVTVAAWTATPQPLLNGWLMLDAAGLLFLTITSILFLACSVYAFGYLAIQGAGKQQDYEEGTLFTNAPDAVFCACLEAFLATMTLVTVSRHFGLLWVRHGGDHAGQRAADLLPPAPSFARSNVEVPADLLGGHRAALARQLPDGHRRVETRRRRHRHRRRRADRERRKPERPLAQSRLLSSWSAMERRWAWLPCTHGCRTHTGVPSVISALLSGALLNCAFLAILRSYQVCAAADKPRSARTCWSCSG